MMKESKVLKAFEWAKEESRNSDFHQCHIGAVILLNGNLLVKSHNSTKTSPLQKQYNYFRGYDPDIGRSSLHAECAALQKIRYLDVDRSKLSIFVYREHKNGKKALAKPCAACTQLIKDMKIKHAYYTTEDGWCYERIE